MLAEMYFLRDEGEVRKLSWVGLMSSVLGPNEFILKLYVSVYCVSIKHC